MKLRKQIVFNLLVVANCFAFGQDKALDLYNLGMQKFQIEKYKAADSLFTLSINLLPQADTYYNLALTKMRLNDTCGYCENMKNAKEYGDKNAGGLFELKCTIKRKVNFDNKLHPDSVFYAFFSKYICTNTIVKRSYCIKNLTDNSVSTYDIESDTMKMDKNNFPGSFPDFSKFTLDKKFVFLDTLKYHVVEVMPTYPGGDEARIDFLVKNIKYPNEAKQKGIQGTVWVAFAIEADGHIDNVYVSQGIGGGCDDEAMRVIRMMPKWIPGTQFGKPVRVIINMPIKFTL